MKNYYPIHYKQIPTQYAFQVYKTEEGFRIRQTQVGNPETEKVFESKEEADRYINQIKELL